MTGGVREARFEATGVVDLRRTLGPLTAGAGDPSSQLAPDEAWRATRTPEGPATLQLRIEPGGALHARAWGAGTRWALTHASDLAGLGDVEADAAPDTLLPDAPAAVHRLGRLARGTRLPRTHRVVEMLVLIVLQQKVSGKEAARAYRNLVRTFSSPAPGPDGIEAAPELWLPLAPETLRDLAPASFPPLGVLARQGETLRRLGRHARRLEEAAHMAPADAERRLCAVPGLGPWSAHSALLRGLGHPDAVPVGDWNLPSAVAFTLSGGREERADDARMLELLEPCRGQRGRVIRWIHAVGRHPPRRGPRMPLRRVPPGRTWVRRLRG